MKLIDSILTEAAGIAAIRRDIHAHPELCFEEARTPDVAAARRDFASINPPKRTGCSVQGRISVGVPHWRGFNPNQPSCPFCSIMFVM